MRERCQSGDSGTRLEQLYGTLVHDLKIPLRPPSLCSKSRTLTTRIHNKLDELVSSSPEFIASFVHETRKLADSGRGRTQKQKLEMLHTHVCAFLIRVGTDEDDEGGEGEGEGEGEGYDGGLEDGSEEISSFASASEESGSVAPERYSPSPQRDPGVKAKSEPRWGVDDDNVIMLSDDDLESVASDSSTYQRLIARVRVKSEAKSESVSATVRTGRLNDLDDDDDPADQGDDNNDDSEEDVFHTSLAINIQEASLKTIDIQAIIDDAENVGGNDDLEDGDMDWQVQDDDFEPLEDDHSSSRASSPESESSVASFVTADNRTPSKLQGPSPIKRKRQDMGDGPDTPSRRRFLAIRVALSESGSNSEQCTPPMPPPLRHSGATELAQRLRIASSPPARPAAVPAPIASRAALNVWDPAKPVQPPSGADMFLELIPRNGYQQLMNGIHVQYGVQWEAERLVQESGGSWSDFHLGDIHKLKGNSFDVIPLLPSIVRNVRERKAREACTLPRPGDAHDVPSPVLCAEMDTEEDSIAARDMRGLGDGRWYGGKLTFAVAVQYQAATGRDADVFAALDSPFSFRLLRVDQSGKSTRLARRFGSRRVLSIRFGSVPSSARTRLFLMFRGRALVLFGRVFRVLFVPPDSDSAVAVETDERAPLGPELRLPLMPSFLELLQGYNFLEAKPGQAMAKWASRIQLLLSDSIPGIPVERDAIVVVDDIVCASAKYPSDPQTSEILTDGCGLMSEELARRIWQLPAFDHLTSRPSSIQMRLGGSKGLLTLMSAAEQEEYKGKHVVLRHSMVKSFPHPEFASDPSLFVLDILKADPIKVGANLSSEPLIVMEHNGVPRDTICSLAQRTLNELRDTFRPTPHDGETAHDVAERLIASTWRWGGVGSDRKRREAAAKGRSAKVTGLIGGHQGVDEEERSEEIGLAEKLYEMLLVGFRPTVEEGGCVYAATKLRMLVQNLARKAVTDLRIPISQSASAFIVPDTQGLLAPDEVFVSFAGDEPIDPETGRSINYLEGDCILFRYPCKLPTDVRKFKAVVKRELCDLRGCIVLSADKWKCTASPASFLAGGDYDGDIATVVWDPALVVPFKDAPDTDALPPEDFGSNFVKHVTSVRDFLSAVRRPNANSASGNPNPNRDSELDSATLIANLQHFLLGSLLDEHLTGVYSELHAVSVYTRGCGHPDTRRLAHMFCSVLDARKSGLSVPPSVKSDDYRKNPGELAWIRAKKEKGDEAYNVRYAQRPVELGPFIMDVLQDILRAKQYEVLRNFPDPAKVSRLGEDLSRFSEPYEFLRKQGEGCRLTLHDGYFNTQINMLHKHVTICLRLLDHIFSAGNADATPVTKLYQDLWRDEPLPPVRRRDTRGGTGYSHIAGRVAELALVWRDGLTPDNVQLILSAGWREQLAELKVSCAVACLRARRKPVKAPFELDLATMCTMMARFSGCATRTLPADMAARLRPAFSYTPAQQTYTSDTTTTTTTTISLSS